MGIKVDNYFIGGAGFTGALLSNLTVSILGRRSILLIGHFVIFIGHILIFTFINLNKGSNSVLLSMLVVVLSFQMSNGAMFFMYAAEVVVDSAIGICLLVLMGLLVV